MTGIILLNKEQNMTSFSACNRLRHILGEKKAGHMGTLDPMATGVLPIALSSATKFIDLLPTHNKAYEAQARLGITTDTLDITGKKLSESDVNVTRRELEKVCEGFKGEILQTPPMYSAISKDGKRLYELARNGVEIEREKRKITIYSLEISEFDGLNFKISVECSQGTYIRSLCDDIGRELGCGATLTRLKRTKSNGFLLEDCHTLKEIETAFANGEIGDLLIPVEDCFTDFGIVTVTRAQARRFSNGGELSSDRLRGSLQPGVYRVFSDEGVFLGLGEIKDGGDALRAKKVFVNG